MPPLAGNAVGADEHLPANDNTAADAGAEDDAEHRLGAGPYTVGGFRQHKTVGVVGEADFALQHRLQVALQGWPMRQVELAFLIRPVSADSVPGMPTPTLRAGRVQLRWPRPARRSPTVAR